jgi:hypothetical protein
MTATKAIAGGIAANIVTVTLWVISNIPDGPLFRINPRPPSSRW